MTQGIFHAVPLCVLAALMACGGGAPSAPSTPPGPPSRVISLSGDLAFTAVVGATATATLVISNSGNTTLTVTDVSAPAQFGTNWRSGTIPAGGAQAVVVTFTPGGTGIAGGSLVVQGDQTAGTNAIAVNGTAVPDLRGTWQGTTRTSYDRAVTQGRWTCAIRVLVTDQPGAQFRGDWQTSGATIDASAQYQGQSCGQTGTLEGVVSSAGVLSGLRFSSVFFTSGDLCAWTGGGEKFSGVVVNNILTISPLKRNLACTLQGGEVYLYETGLILAKQ